MKTLRLKVNVDRLSEPEAQAALDAAAEILRGGGTVALPTETVYGLGANALDAAAVAKIFAAKGRPGWDPLIVHVADEAMLQQVVAEVSERARRLMDSFWPGPLTLLLPRAVGISDAVTAGRPLVGVRMPAHAVARELIRRAAVPVAAPSANRFGHVSPTRAEHVLADLDGRIDAVVDAGPTACGVESTVVGFGETGGPLVVYRPGAITIEQIRDVAGAAEMYAPDAAATLERRAGLPSPGVGLRHYAPRARLVLVEGDATAMKEEMLRHSEERVGVMLPDGISLPDGLAKGMVVFRWGRWGDAESLARGLFAGLRDLDEAECAVIVCPTPPEAGIGAAVRDRLRKAAMPREAGES